MQLVTARDSVRECLGGRTDIDGRILTALNWAQTRAVLLIPTRGSQKVGVATIPLAAITAHEFRYTLPDRTRTILGITLVKGTSSVTLRYLSRKDRETRYPNPVADSQGQPCYFTLYATWFELYPPPSADYVDLECMLSCWPTDMILDVDLVEPVGLESLTIKMAVSYTYMMLKEYAAADLWKKMAMEELMIARSIELERMPEDLLAVPVDILNNFLIDADIDNPFRG